ncbi:MAG: hypothetical protein Q7S66_02430 [bacterium]|nr:hypothetical protein [bacterium]
MKKTTLIILAGTLLFLTGCAHQTPAADTDVNWKTYQNEKFSINYPASFDLKILQGKYDTIVDFTETPPQENNFPYKFSITTRPNSAGLNLDTLVNEMISQSSWNLEKIGSKKISGQTAYIIVVPDLDDEQRYVFLSKDGGTIFDLSIFDLSMQLNQETADLVFASFKLSDSVSVDPDFRITNIANSSDFATTVTSVFPIIASGCDIYAIKDGVPLRYSKIDFFITKDAPGSHPTRVLGTTLPGSAGSGECDLSLEESEYDETEQEAGKYRIWAVRSIGNVSDKRTADVRITIVNN